MLRRMRIGIIGAGAIGGFFAARLAHAGHDVAVLARGDTLTALQQRGIRLDSGGQSIEATVKASDDAETLGVQDLLILAVKSPALPQVQTAAAAMSDDQTVVLPALNGLPWWFFLPQRALAAADPGGHIAQALPLARVLATVVYPACSSIAPGHVRHAAGERIVVGEPGGGQSARATAIAQVLSAAGFAVEASAKVREEVWLKLLGNACFNPVSLITRAWTDELIDDPAVHALFEAMMTETLAIGRAAGLALDVTPAQRLATTRRLGHVRTSMLQDGLAGKPVELDAILGTLLETAVALGVPAPHLQTVLTLARAHARAAGLLPAEATPCP